MLLVTPQAANKTIGQGGFQEVEQMALFRDMVCYQEEVRDPSRTAEVLNRVITKAKRLSAPAQINIPRDYWTQVIDIDLPAIVEFERPSGGSHAVAEAAKLLSVAKFPVILSGAGVVLGNAIPECVALAEKLDAPVCNNYQHNDSFPGSHRLAVGPLGYNGSKAAMELVAKADVVLALGTRLNPFSTLPGYGIDYWPKTAKIIQVDINADRIGLTKPVTVGICGDAKLVAQGILAQLSPSAGNAGREDRKALIHTTRSKWLQTLSSMDHEDDDPGTTWNADARKRNADRVRPGGPSRLDCPRMRSSRATSATTAPSATLIRHSIKVENTWRLGFLGRVVTAFHPLSAPRSAIRIRPVSASPVTAPSESR
jgi:sulfoacetaldehyde acetyltransferase